MLAPAAAASAMRASALSTLWAFDLCPVICTSATTTVDGVEAGGGAAFESAASRVFGTSGGQPRQTGLPHAPRMLTYQRFGPQSGPRTLKASIWRAKGLKVCSSPGPTPASAKRMSPH